MHLDWTRAEQFGLPQARLRVAWGKKRQETLCGHAEVSVQILKSAGAEIFNVYEQATANHKLGGRRLLRDSRRSVVNSDWRSHDVANLYVVDGSVVPSASENELDAYHREAPFDAARHQASTPPGCRTKTSGS